MTEISSGAAAGVQDPAEDTFTMQDWLDGSSDFKTLRKGEVVEGTVMAVQRDGVLVDLGSKSEGIIPTHEMHSMGADPLSKVNTGDTILVYVMQPEADQGQITLSVDRARGERGWRVLQQRFEDGEAFEGEVTGYNKGGLLVNVEGVHAFVPLSQVVGVRPDRDAGDGGLGQAVGKQLRLKVIEINRRRNRVILSERAALQEWRSQQKDRLLAELKEGEVRTGRVSSVRSFGVFIDLGGADGLAHLSEVSWDRNKSPEEMYKVGDEVEVYVMKVDPESKKIALSLRRAQPEQWDMIVDKYQQGRVVPGMVTKLVTFGAFARIEGPVEGLIHVSELVDRRIAHPKEVVREGDLLPLKIVRIERDRHRLGLSLREAREEGERMGFRFTDGGEVMEVPDDVRKEFEEREGVTVPEFTGPVDGGASDTIAASEPPAAERAAPAPVREPEPEEPPRSALADALHAAGAAEAFRDTPPAEDGASAVAAGNADAAAGEPVTVDDAPEPVAATTDGAAEPVTVDDATEPGVATTDDAAEPVAAIADDATAPVAATTDEATEPAAVVEETAAES